MGAVGFQAPDARPSRSVNAVDRVRTQRLYWPLLGAVTLVGLVLRLASLSNSLFGDELGTYFIVTRHGVGGIVHLLDGRSVDLTPPLYFLATWLVEQLGDSVEGVRAVSLVAGTAAIPLTYLLGGRTVGRRAGLVGAALIALSPFLIFYSTEARAYALVMTLVLGSTLSLLRALDSGQARWWVGYSALMCAAAYTHYTSVFCLATQLVWAFVLHPPARRALVLSAAGAAVGFAPWIPALIKNSHSFGTKVFGVLEPFSAGAVVHDVVHWAVGHPFLALGTIPGTVGLVAIVVGLGIAVVGAAMRPLAVQRRLARPPVLLPMLLAIATPVGLAVYSLVREDTWDMRNLIVSWPGLALTFGALATARPRVRMVATGLLLAGFVVGAGQLLSPGHQRPQYGPAARFVLRSGSRTDPVAIITAPTPGPLAAMDAAFAYSGDPRRPLLRIGAPTLQATLAAAPYALLPPVPAASLAAQAEHVPAGGRLFVVAPGTVPIKVLLRSGVVDPLAALGPDFGAGTSGRIYATVFVPLSAFLRAVEPAFRPVGTRVFPGILNITVYELERR